MKDYILTIFVSLIILYTDLLDEFLFGDNWEKVGSFNLWIRRKCRVISASDSKSSEQEGSLQRTLEFEEAAGAEDVWQWMV